MRVCLNLRFHRGGLALPAALPLACICSLVGFIRISCFAIFATLIFAYRRCCVTSPHVVIGLSRLVACFLFLVVSITITIIFIIIITRPTFQYRKEVLIVHKS